jgi:hypothetical protein
MKTQTILDNLTLAQAEAWEATTEKFLFVDDEIVSQYGISLNALPTDNLLNAIEGKFERLLARKNLPVFEQLQTNHSEYLKLLQVL